MGLTMDDGSSRKLFASQVAQSLLGAEGLEPSSNGFINIASIDISRKRIHELLRKCMTLDGKSLNGRLKQDPFVDGEYNEQGYTKNPHVTLAHYSQLQQKAMRARFEPILGKEIDVIITGLVWNKSIAALSVDIAAKVEGGGEVPKALNSFPHITVWHDKGVSAAESNKLPDLLASGNAESLTLPEPIVLKGKCSFWSLGQH